MCGFVVMQGLEKKGELKKSLEKIKYRGPDNSAILNVDNFIFAFNRLAIMDLSESGNQPFRNDNLTLVCNGEIYNYKSLKNKDYPYISDSDCEVLLSLYQEENNFKTFCQKLDAEFALVLYDHKTQSLKAARDHMGIRPLFYTYDDQGKIQFASEVKSLQVVGKKVIPFPPGHYYENGEIKKFIDHAKERIYLSDMSEILKGINEKLTKAVDKRLNSDAQVGFLLSGGLDSSLVCALAQKKSDKPIKTFAIGIDTNPIDAKYAQIVADYIGSDHTTVIFKEADILRILDTLVYRLETWDVTTIRASVGMYLVCEHIKKHTDIKVLLTGEVSDELFGYKYTDFAPNADEFQKEALKRIEELFYYDVLRADRCIASHSLEARVPFSDLDFVDFVMNINPEIKMNKYKIGKYLLRAAFKDINLLPEEILMREKAAFSDAVGHRSVDFLKEIAEAQYTDEEFKNKIKDYQNNIPHSKEELYYREIFLKHFSDHTDLIPSLWLPNQNWENCQVSDPSARALPNYGKSGE